MALHKDTKLPSGKTLSQVRANLKRQFKGKNRSKKSSDDFPSMTLAEQRELGLDIGTTMVVSFGKKRK